MAKGMKTGGREAGVPNKFHSGRASEIERQGKRLPPANLLLIAENSMAMAARFQPEVTDPVTREKRPNPDYDRDQYAFWLDRAREALRDAAPYYAPKLHAVAIATPPSVDDNAGRVDPREHMWQVYKQMRKRGELAMKTVSNQTPKAAETGTNSTTPVPEPAVVAEDDDGDGVAV
jgi:hypothetical protein